MLMEERRKHRIYVPLTPQMLGQSAYSSCEATVVDDRFLACAHLPPLSQLHGENREVAEDMALYQAAAHSWGLQSSSAHPRVVVAVAEYAGEITPVQEEAGQYCLSRPLELGDVVSFHVSEELPLLAGEEGARGETGAKFTLGAGTGQSVQAQSAGTGQVLPIPDLLWFDVSEFKLVKEFLGITD